MINRIEFWVNKFCNFFCKYKIAGKIFRISLLNIFQINGMDSCIEINFIFVKLSLSLLLDRLKFNLVSQNNHLARPVTTACAYVCTCLLG
jgi:hypothetical protein